MTRSSFRGPGRRGAPLGRRRARGVAAALGPHRVGGVRVRRQGLRGLPRGLDLLKERRREPASTAWQQALEEPLLVTDLVNVRYLTGFDSSNAALLVEPDGRAGCHRFPLPRGGAGGRGRRASSRPSRRRGRSGRAARRRGSGSRRDDLRTLIATICARRRRSRPARGLVEQLRAVKDEGEIEAIRRAAAISDRSSGAHGGGSSGAPSRDRLVTSSASSASRRRGARVRARSSAPGANGATPHAARARSVIEAGELVVVDMGAVGGYCSDCTRTLATASSARARGLRVCRGAAGGLAASVPA